MSPLSLYSSPRMYVINTKGKTLEKVTHYPLYWSIDIAVSRLIKRYQARPNATIRTIKKGKCYKVTFTNSDKTRIYIFQEQ